MWTASLSGGILGYAQFPPNSGLPGLDAEIGDNCVNGVGTATANVVVQTAPGTCTAQYTLPSDNPLAQICAAEPSFLNAAIQVQDADLTGPSVQVQVTSNEDNEIFTLPQISPGVYRLMQLPITRGGKTAMPRNGSIDIPATNAVPIVLTIKYTDATSPNGSNVVRQTTLQLLPYRIK